MNSRKPHRKQLTSKVARPKKASICSQPSWVIRNATVELAVTERGAQMAPVTFCRDEKRAVQPYYISPWQNERHKDLPAVLQALRGDFFCLPFGANHQPYRGQQHLPHGETANRRWTLEGVQREENTLTMALNLRSQLGPAKFRREFTIRTGHNVVYCCTSVEDWSGSTPFAHHAILRVPDRDRRLIVSTSRFTTGYTYPVAYADPSLGEYQYLATNREFRSLSRIPSIYRDHPTCDYEALPAKTGFCDLFQQFEHPSSAGLSWVTAINAEENWMWFAFKDSKLMPGRLFWMEAQGRHAYPWNGRNRCLGIEDGCMYFDRGIYESCNSNPLNRRGIPTCVRISKRKPFAARYIQGAITLPDTFTKVVRVTYRDSVVIFHSKDGQSVETPVDLSFLRVPLSKNAKTFLA